MQELEIIGDLSFLIHLRINPFKVPKFLLTFITAEDSLSFFPGRETIGKGPAAPFTNIIFMIRREKRAFIEVRKMNNAIPFFFVVFYSGIQYL